MSMRSSDNQHKKSVIFDSGPGHKKDHKISKSGGSYGKRHRLHHSKKKGHKLEVINNLSDASRPSSARKKQNDSSKPSGEDPRNDTNDIGSVRDHIIDSLKNKVDRRISSLSDESSDDELIQTKNISKYDNEGKRAISELELANIDLIASRESDGNKTAKPVLTDDSTFFLNTLSSDTEEWDPMAALQERSRSIKEAIASKYKNTKFDHVTRSKRALRNRVCDNINIIDELLLDFKKRSMFYDKAEMQARSSLNETLSASDRNTIDWNSYFGGYFGFKRQLFISSVIFSLRKKELLQAAKKYPVVSFWTIDGFCTYILANELILKFIMQDFQCSLDDAKNTISDSVEYGLYVTDTIDMHDDLDFEELVTDNQTIKKSTKESTGSNPAQSSHSVDDMYLSNSHRNKSDLLDQLLESSSDSSDIE